MRKANLALLAKEVETQKEQDQLVSQKVVVEDLFVGQEVLAEDLFVGQKVVVEGCFVGQGVVVGAAAAVVGEAEIQEEEAVGRQSQDLGQ